MGVTNKKMERAPSRGSDPYVGVVAINYGSGDQVFDENPRALVLSTGGTLVLQFIDGSQAPMILAANVIYPFQIQKIIAAGSSAAVGHVLL